MSQQTPSVGTFRVVCEKYDIKQFQVFATRCEECLGRSSWDFVQDCYLRVEKAESYVQMLEKRLFESQKTAQQCHAALAQCEMSLSASWEILNEERLHHRASREALAYESERHRETAKMLEYMSQEVIRRGGVADILSSRLSTAPNLSDYQAVPTLDDFMTEATPLGNTSTESMPTSDGQQIAPAQRLLLLPPPRSLQTATRGCKTETPINHQVDYWSTSSINLSSL